MIETLAQEEFLECLERPSPPNLRVHLLQRRGLLFNAEQGKKIRQRVFKCYGLRLNTLPVTLAAPLALIVVRFNPEITLEQLDHRQIRGGFAMRDRIGLKHQASSLRVQGRIAIRPYEFVEQPGLA